jgi:hypothetical protein
MPRPTRNGKISSKTKQAESVCNLHQEVEAGSAQACALLTQSGHGLSFRQAPRIYQLTRAHIYGFGGGSRINDFEGGIGDKAHCPAQWGMRETAL